MSPTKPAGHPAVLIAVALLASLTASGCKPRAQAAPPPPPAGAEGERAGAGGGARVNDAQIAHIAVTANSIDSAMGELAKRKARSAAVKNFAQTMITDHGSVNRQAVQLAERLDVTPEANDVSRQLQQAAEEARADLNGKSGAEFDRAYIAREVEYHQQVLDALDKTLVPNAHNADLKNLLQSVRPAFVAHLERAKQLQSSLGNP